MRGSTPDRRTWRCEPPAAGAPLLSLYGPAWRYVKTQDYRDWRVLEEQATLDICNLTDKPLSAEVRLRGVAISGTMVLINSGGAAGAGSAGSVPSPKAPDKPDTADDGTKGGKM